jgi:hypothetical protein
LEKICLQWFVDGEFAHLTTGMTDFDPTNPNDDQIYVVVDLRDPRRPREVGHWWYPGTRKGDACLPGCLPLACEPVGTVTQAVFIGPHVDPVVGPIPSSMFTLFAGAARGRLANR